jgi:serine/threonine protein kinase
MALFFMNTKVGIIFNMTSVDLHTYKNKYDMSIQDIAFTSLGTLNGIRELHSNGLIHCDIKLENVVVCKETRQPKLIDLDFATRNDPISTILDEESFGTNGLIAPEMIKRKWNNSIDFFGLGHLLKELCHKDKRAIGVFRTVYESLLKENPEERSCFQNQEFIVQPVIDQIKSALEHSPLPQQYSGEFIEKIFKLREATKSDTVEIKLL